MSCFSPISFTITPLSCTIQRRLASLAHFKKVQLDGAIMQLARNYDSCNHITATPIRFSECCFAYPFYVGCLSMQEYKYDTAHQRRRLVFGDAYLCSDYEVPFHSMTTLYPPYLSCIFHNVGLIVGVVLYPSRALGSPCGTTGRRGILEAGPASKHTYLSQQLTDVDYETSYFLALFLGLQIKLTHLKLLPNYWYTPNLI